jgi:hypothetical protein
MQPASDRCVHDFSPGQCGICSITDPLLRVWVSGGGRAYHKARSCPGLVEGQEKIWEAGGEVAEVRRVSLAEAVELGRVACQVCDPPKA